MPKTAKNQADRQWPGDQSARLYGPPRPAISVEMLTETFRQARSFAERAVKGLTDAELDGIQAAIRAERLRQRGAR